MNAYTLELISLMVEDLETSIPVITGTILSIEIRFSNMSVISFF